MEIYPVNSGGQTILNSLTRWLENPLRIAYVNYGRGSNHFPSHVHGSGVETREALAATLFLCQTEVRKAKKYHFQDRVCWVPPFISGSGWTGPHF